MSLEFTKYEDGGMFYLSARPGCACDFMSDDLGKGNSDSITRFFTAEGREYYIQAENARAGHNRAVHELECLKASIRKIIKKRSIRKLLRELVKEI